MSKRFPEYKGLDLAKVNNEVLKMWDDNDTFRRSLRSRDGKGEFVFYEGPPSANGMPGIHHVMARAIKDTFCRYKTMKGYVVKRKAGWDTHGLPVELGVEKSLGITKEDIGTKDLRRRLQRSLPQGCDEIYRRVGGPDTPMGYWVDMENPYVTYDNRYIETLWWLLKELYKKGLLYKGYTIQPFSPAAGTGLSSHELNMPGCYRDVKDTTCIALFSVIRNDAVGISLRGYRHRRSEDHGMDHHTVDPAFKHRPGRGCGHQICEGENCQSLYLRTHDRHPCRRAAAGDLCPRQESLNYTGDRAHSRARS